MSDRPHTPEQAIARAIFEDKSKDDTPLGRARRIVARLERWRYEVREIPDGCTYRKSVGRGAIPSVLCRKPEDDPIHVHPDERMRPGGHVYRDEAVR